VALFINSEHGPAGTELGWTLPLATLIS
jgi:hypothetical protein